MTALLFALFGTFFIIGLFGFGGGYAMLSLIQSKVVTEHGWLTPGQFTDIVAISQMTPGPIGINSATFTGYSAMVNAGHGQVAGVFGSLMATFAVVLPSFVLMLLISKFLMKYREHPVVDHVFCGLRPAVVGLIASASLCLMTAENFGSPASPWQFGISLAIFLFAFVSHRTYRLNPLLIIALSALAGVILF